MIENHDNGHNDSVSESEKEILQWEMEKLKNGISSTNNRIFISLKIILGVSFGNKNIFKKEKEQKKDDLYNRTGSNIKNYFKNINIDINLEKIVDNIKNECDNEEVN